MESSIVNEIYQEGKKEGIETLKNSIVEILIARFDLTYNTGKKLEESIKPINSIPSLQKLVIDAALSKSLDEFLKKIK
ncbi:MAG: hypothetical protein ACE5J3_09545 [Methanosarcinales archaeon]